MDLPPLTALRAFEATARHLSFTRAAEELSVTHAAVSHQIRNLEEWFATELFVRRGRHVALTRAGEMLFRQVSPALAEMADACGRVKALGGKETLMVGCIPSIASRWLVPNLHAFTARHPELDVRVIYAPADQRFADGGLDVLITLDPEESTGIRSQRLFSRRAQPVCSPGFLKRWGPFDAPRRIARSPLLHDGTRDGWQAWFAKAGTDGPAGDTSPVYEDFNLLAMAAIAGHGVTLCPVDMFRMEIARGDLVVISDISINEDAAYVASHRMPPKPAVEGFVAWLARLVRFGG